MKAVCLRRDLLQFLEIFIFKSHVGVQAQSGIWCTGPVGDLVLSLAVAHGFKSLFLGLWQHKGWFLSNGVEKRVFLEITFLIYKISRLQDVMLKGPAVER